MQQLVHRLRHRPTRERDADRLEDLPGSDTLFVCQGTQRLLERFRRPISLAEDGDTRLERRLVTRRILGDLLFRFVVERDEFRVEPHGHLLRHVERGARAGLHAGDRFQDGVLVAVQAELRELGRHQGYNSSAVAIERYCPFIHSSFVMSKMAGFFWMPSKANSCTISSSVMISRSPPGLQPSSARKLRIAAGRIPMCW